MVSVFSRPRIRACVIIEILVLYAGGDLLNDEQEFYRCLVSDAAGRTLLQIWKILKDETLNDETCFQKIEAILSLYEDLGLSSGGRHDFG